MRVPKWVRKSEKYVSTLPRDASFAIMRVFQWVAKVQEEKWHCAKTNVTEQLLVPCAMGVQPLVLNCLSSVKWYGPYRDTNEGLGSSWTFCKTYLNFSTGSEIGDVACLEQRQRWHRKSHFSVFDFLLSHATCV